MDEKPPEGSEPRDDQDAASAANDEATLGSIRSLSEIAREAAQHANRLGREFAKVAAEGTVTQTKQAASASRAKVDEGVKTVTLREYRDEVEAVLQEITQVLIAQDAEIRLLRDQVEELRTQSEQPE